MKKLICLLAICGVMTEAHAAAISFSDRDAFEASAGPLGLEDFDSQPDGAAFDESPLDVGAFTLTVFGTPPDWEGRYEIDAPPYNVFGIHGNGTKQANVLTNPETSLVLTFDTAINAFGVDLFSLNNDSELRTRINAAGESFAPNPTDTGDRFFGIVSDTEFTTLEFQGVWWDGYGLDNVRFSSSEISSVPEPATLALMSIGLAGLGLARRRKIAP